MDRGARDLEDQGLFHTYAPHFELDRGAGLPSQLFDGLIVLPPLGGATIQGDDAIA